MDKILSACEGFLEWSTGRSEPILVDDVVYFKRYPEQYPVPYPDQKQTDYTDVLDRGWDTFKKQREEMSKYDYIFPGWSKFLTSSWAGGSSLPLPGLMGGSAVNYMFLDIERDRDPAKPTYNSGGSSHYRQFARAAYTGVCSFYASLSTLVEHFYNGDMQVLS